MKEGWFEGADGTKLYYHIAGNGVPLVLCDGIGCDGYAWRYFNAYFGDQYQMVHWHYKGHGRSEMPANFDHVSIPDLATDLSKLFELLDLPKAVLVGHSMGVQVIYEFWHLFPDKVAGLVPICGSYGNPLDTFHDNSILKTAFPFLKTIIDSQPVLSQKIWSLIVHSELAYQIATRFEVNGEFVQREDFTPYFDHIGEIDTNLFANMLAEAQEHDGKPFLPNIDIPVLIVGGEQDTFTPQWLSRDMQKLIPNSELMIVKKGSHTVPIEFPELVNLRVEKFLNERVIPSLKTKKKTTPKKKAAPKKKAVAKKKALVKPAAKEQTETSV